MSDDNRKDIDDFFDQFERIDEEPFDVSNSKDDPVIASRLERNKSKKEKLNKNSPDKKSPRREKRTKKNEMENEKSKGKGKSKKKDKKPSSKKKKALKIIGCILLLLILAAAGLVGYIAATTPSVDYNNIYALLSETSTLYDDEGTVIETIYLGDGKRTRVDYDQMPEDLINAFIAIEDKTFWDHHGFNFVRIMGAIKDSVFGGTDISGTSTITQQLARNLWLAETKSERSMTRKLKEAYYAFQLERHLSKEQIIEAYLNTIALGNHSYGVQAASEGYFSKDVQDLDLVQCAQLACLPQAPTKYALVKTVSKDEVLENDPELIAVGEINAYMYNNAIENRYQRVLNFMKEQSYISDAEYSAASTADLKASLNPNLDEQEDTAAYFVDYTINTIAEDLMEEYHTIKSIDEAKQRVYSGGFEIHTTLNLKMQQIVEEEFADNSNFPGVTGLNFDSWRNIIGEGGKVLLYSYNNYFDTEGVFTLWPEEYEVQPNGDVLLKKDMRLNFYKTEVEGSTDYSVEFKDLYIIEEGVFYSIKGGVINIPAKYKTRDDDGNIIVSKEFFDESPEAFIFNDSGISITHQYYALKQKVVQPQSAMVILDHRDGSIKAMVGGRNIEGRMLFNRANEPRQPGSAIKPIGVYGAALQMGADGERISGGKEEYGSHWTAASVINDAPMTLGGRTWPKNWYNGYRGYQTMRRSVEQSVNVNAVKVFLNIGEKRSAEFAKSLGVTTLTEEGDNNDLNPAALALGGMTKGVSPLEMAAAYGTFPNEGEYIKPSPYSKIEKRDDVIIDKEPDAEQVMDAGAAFIMNDILRTTVSNGIASSANIGSQPVAGKTGTTTDNYDAWFVGCTPQFAAALWIGNDVNIELSEGSASAARAWSRIMRKACEGIPAERFPARPENVYVATVSAPQGTATSSDDSGVSGLIVESKSEYFIRGTSPPNVEFSSGGEETYICPDSGYLATGECPNPVSKLFNEENPAPGYYCQIHNSDFTKWPVDPALGLNPPPEEEEPIEPVDPEPTGPAISPSATTLKGDPWLLQWHYTPYNCEPATVFSAINETNPAWHSWQSLIAKSYKNLC